MRDGGSVWWPLDVSAERWFTEEERDAAQRYHQPSDRALGWRSAAQVSLLVTVLVVSATTELVWSVQAGAVIGAIAGPRLVVDVWREFIHEPRFGGTPVSGAAFALAGSGRLALDATVVAFAGRWIGTTAPDPTGIALVAVALFMAPFLVAIFGSRIVVALHRAADLSAEERSGRVDELASARGMPPPRLVVLDPHTFDGANALATGTGRRVTVAVSRRLLEAPAELFDHVVGHELAHLRRRHIWWSALVSGSSLVVIMVGSVIVATDYSPESARLAALCLAAVVAGVPFRLGLAWLSRVHERQADLDALRIGSIAPELVRQLHLDQQPRIDPSAMARWFSAHPMPAERLERVARAHRRRTTMSST